MADSRAPAFLTLEPSNNSETSESRLLNRSFLVKSRWRAYVQSVSNFAIFAGVLVLASRVTISWQYCAAFFAIGCLQHRLFFPVHDCIHYSLFPSKTENSLVGTLMAPLIGTSFDAIRVQHMNHHREFGKPQDPGASDYFVHFRSRGDLIFFLLGPLFGSVVFNKLGDYIRRPSVAARQEGKSNEETSGLFMHNIRSYGVILFVQALIAAILTSGFTARELWRYPAFYILPLATVFLFLNRLRMYAEHGSLDYRICNYFERKRPTARTIYPTTIERLILCGNNFNYHHEHHRYPAVPGWQLPRLHRLIGPGLDRNDIRQSYFQAMAELWRNLPVRAPARY